MLCTACGFQNPNGTKFCGRCGERLGVVPCPKCHFENPPNFKFCGECGGALTTPVPSRPSLQTDAAERRQITVLFCDLVDSTALADRLDPEEFRDIVQQYQHACSEAVAEYGGHIAQYLGDGLLVYFGYPKAHEDDARRAVHAGLGIVVAIRRLSDRLATSAGTELSCRVGIHTGEVVTGQVGAGDTAELLAMGQAPNVAARVQGIAEPNTIVLTGAVDRLVRGYFDCESLGNRTIKGLSKPVELYRVIRHSGVRDSFEVAKTRGLTPVAGRQAEIDTLLREAATVAGGTGRIVIVSGEGGIGKSRLVQILRERTSQEIPQWFMSRCSAYHQQSALSPFIDLVTEHLGITGEMPNQERLARIEAFVGTIGLPVADLTPLLAEFLSVSTAARYPPLRGTPQKRKENILDALLTVLVTVAEREPAVLVVEDLHWADPSTLDFLQMILARVPSLHLLIVLTHRTAFELPWSDTTHLTTMRLSRLEADHVMSMIGALTGGMAFPPELIDQVMEKTDGVPLYVEELTKMILESDLLTPGSMGYELTRPLPPLAIPATLQDSLTARLDHLGEAKVLAQVGSVIGREFGYDMIQAVYDADAMTVEQQLARLVHAGILQQDGMPPDARYAFRHALVEDAAYASLVRTTREAYHRQTADAIATQFPDELETRPEIAAHHYCEAGDHESAVTYWTRAGRRAVDRSANLEAATHLRSALALMERTPPSAERYGQEIQIQSLLGSAIIAARGYTSPEARAAFARALELSEPMGDVPELFRGLQGLWMFHVVRADYAQALELANRLQRAAPEPDRALRMQSHYCVGFTRFFLGHFEAAQREFELAITLDAPDTDFHTVSPTGDDIRIHVLSFMALNLWHLGFPDQAREQIYRAVDRARTSGHPFGISWALCIQGWVYQFLGDPEESFVAARESLAIAQSNGFSYIVGLSNFLVGLGTVQTQSADEAAVDQGIARMQHSVGGMVQTGARLGETLMVSQLIDSVVTIGRLDVATATLAENRAGAPSMEERAWEAEFHRQTGVLALANGEEGAEAAFREAVRVADEQGARALALRATMGLARSLARQGLAPEGRTVLADRLASFKEGDATGDIRTARALTTELA